MARKTKQESEATREAIIEAATWVFVEKGVAKATLEQIAQQAGVTRGAVYWHFKNKLDVFTAMHDQLYVSTSGMILTELERSHPRPLEQLRELCIKLFQELEINPQKKRILTIFYQKCDYSGEWACFLEYQQQQKNQSFQLLSRYFERAIEKGHLPADSDAQALTRLLSCFITGVAVEYLRYPELFVSGMSAETLINRFFASMPGFSGAPL